MKKNVAVATLGLAALCLSSGVLLCQEPIMLSGQVNLDTSCSGIQMVTVRLLLFRERTPVEDAMVRLDDTFTIPYSGSGVYYLKTRYSNPEPGMPFTITIEEFGLAQPISINGDFSALLTLLSPGPEAVVAVSRGEAFRACWKPVAGADSARVIIQNLSDKRGNVTLLDKIVPGSCLSLPARGILAPDMTCSLEVSQDLDVCRLGGDYFPDSEVIRSTSASCTFLTR